MMRIGALQGRRSALALVASLILNGFLLGMILTDALRPHRGHAFPGPRAVGFELRRLAERLPGDAVDRVAAELEPIGPRLEPRLERIRAIREEIYDLAAAPAADRTAIDERLSALRAEGAAMQEEVQRATLDAILKLPPEVRARLAAEPGSG